MLHCYKEGEHVTHPVLEQVMEWLGLPQNEGAIVIAHCDGVFDL